ncbi:MAG: DNA-directed RNA polymerase subunit omega [Deltaproteobacteria bacterium]|nr:DNA-directed RNA polymerase subunit omega [Deltaproteobacteria bacterium]MCZ6564087.1 DNA-directed RNA polymerase subunit omega [Deltaproteobacteria bacterium]MCZ6906548.1 DNA-directed RNA polymerase subunit omega [Deltaproteobacteria bacterium]
MARITLEDCLVKVSNRFQLAILATKRAKQLLKGAKPLLESDNREIVLALREIAAGLVRGVGKELKPQ